jgi:hypothetical protein
MSVAETILAQLGGNKFLAMTGAKYLTAHDDALSFKLPPSFASSGINYVKITLTPMDVYTVEAYRLRGVKATLVESYDNVYVDMLRSVFTKVTGLNTSL